MEKLTAPYINMNGNSKRQIEEQLINIFKSFNEPIEAINRSDYDNGRNATDNDHHKKMRAERRYYSKLQTYIDHRQEESLRNL